MGAEVQKTTGRKRLPADNLRSELFRFRVSPREMEDLLTASSLVDQTLSQFVRAAALRDAQRVEEVATQVL